MTDKKHKQNELSLFDVSEFGQNDVPNPASLSSVQSSVNRNGKSAGKKSRKGEESKGRKKQEATIMKNLPDTVEWIKQPYALSVMRGDLSLTQTHILVELMYTLKEKINDFLSHNGEEGHAVFKEQDFDEDGIAHVDVSLSAISSRPDYYEEVENMAYNLMSATIKQPKEVEGMKMVKLSHVFHSILVPYEDKEGGAKARRKGFIRFCFDRTQVRDIFTFTRYSKYIKAVARNSKSQYTSRLYMLITAYRAFGTWDVEYSELRKILGFLVYEETGEGRWEWVEKKYSEYRQFKRRVLATAELELKELAKRGEVDCYFDFKEIYPVGKSKGTPHKIHFTITRTVMGQLEAVNSQTSKKIIELDKYLKSSFGLSASERKKLLQSVNNNNVDIIEGKIYDIKKYIDINAETIQDKKKYAYVSIKNVIDDLQLSEEEYEGMPIETVAEVQDEGVTQKDDWKGVKLSDNRLSGVLANCVGMKNYSMYLSQTTIYAYEGTTISLIVPHEEITEFIENNRASVCEALSSVVGKVSVINYIVAKK